MCLGTIDKFEPCKVGYKVMRPIRGKLHPTMMSDCGSIPRGRWVDERDYRPYYCDGRVGPPLNRINYPCGFHIFHDWRDANLWCHSDEVVVKVKVKRPVATGYQYVNGVLRKVTVAKNMRILPPPIIIQMAADPAL